MKCNIQSAKAIVIFLLVLFTFFRGNACGASLYTSGNGDTITVSKEYKEKPVAASKIKLVETIRAHHGIKRGWALLILLLTGPLGGHRIYLGSPAYVPLVYTATIGGGFGILPFLDAFAILFTNDLSKFINNDKVVMWIE